MCGIVACISKGEVIPEVVQKMTSRLSHRGPDAQGIYVHPSGRIALGHTRLSIIDLSPESNQPFYSSNGRFVIVYNGEVYNYPEIKEELFRNHGVNFKTASDTEVIIEAFATWGTGMTSKFNGMFSIVIVDQWEQKLFLFRDRIGKKPLFYFLSDSLFVVASEIKALLEHPEIRRSPMNKKAIGKFLHLGYVPAPETIYQCIYKFPPGHYGEFISSSFKLEIKPYWDIVQAEKLPRINEHGAAKKQLKDLLEDSVRRRLISDVPLGVFLSGGIDSSLVTSIASKQVNGRLKTFSIGFHESKFDERIHAGKIASHLGTDHHEYLLHENEAVGLVEKYINHFDEPFADTSAIPTMMVSALARKDVTVALTGDGGDELFQGYGAYQWADRLDSFGWKMLKSPLRMLLASSGSSRWQRVARLFESVEQGGMRSHIFSQEQYFFSQPEINDSLLSDSHSFEAFEYRDEDAGFSAGEQQAIFDLHYYLVDDLMVKVDRASMYYGLECRSPLLDYRVVELAARLDASFKRKGFHTKIILKDILSDYLPLNLVDRPKQGFSIPLSRWMKSELQPMFNTYLDDALIADMGLINENYCKQMKRDYLSGKDFLYNRLWALIVLNKWIIDHQ